MTSWLFSFENKRIRLQMIFASFLIVATSYVVIQERTTFARRNQAYQVILAAKQLQNDQAVLTASKEFFHNASFFGRDERTKQVIEIYEESLVRWVPQQPEAELTPENKEYLKLYTQLQQL
ncbi:hypothetical protein BV378_15350 [Nostoc sp. RF31YmG]|nr:hypothetical protein BV378_15350 [Nostoc sp. RF31YmG]